MNRDKQLQDFERGLLSDREVVLLFSDLLRQGGAWQWGEHNRLVAEQLIDEGWLDEVGNVTLAVLEL